MRYKIEWSLATIGIILGAFIAIGGIIGKNGTLIGVGVVVALLSIRNIWKLTKAKPIKNR